MEKLAGALTDYVELLTLGALLLSLPAICFKIPLAEYISSIFKRASKGANDPIPAHLIYILLFIILFSTGVIVNAVAYWFLQPSHVHIVNIVRAHAITADPKSRLEPDWLFLALPFARDCKLDPGEYASYREDAKQQAHWQITHPESYRTYSGSVLERSIRLVRGVITVIVAFFALNFVSLVISLIPRPWVNASVVRIKSWWSYLVAIGASAMLYWLLMYSFWWIEALSHREVWATLGLL